MRTKIFLNTLRLDEKAEGVIIRSVQGGIIRHPDYDPRTNVSYDLRDPISIANDL